MRNDFVLPASARESRNQPRHRIEKAPKHHFLLAGSVGAACTVIAISVGFATGGSAIGATAPTPAPSTSAAAPSAPPEPVVRSSITSADGAAAGPVTGGTTVTVTGAALGTVASVTFGGNPGTVNAVSPDTVTITTPPATDFTEGAVPVELFDLSGKPVKVTARVLTDTTTGAASSAASTGTATSIPATPAPATPDPATPDTTTPDTITAAPTAQAAAPQAAAPQAKHAAPAASAALTFNYVQDPRVTAQIDYALAHWSDYNSDVYGVISGNDCVNFTSQSLIARGWAMDGEWSFDTATRLSTPAWNSSTAFAAYLTAHPERATALAADQRNLVKVGDVVQFDWDGSGDRDHTGIVSRVDKTAAGVTIYYAGHTGDTDFKSVDDSLANAGGTVSYWSIH
jgi:Putative amidase domain/IPT/TIG domain